MQIQRPEVGCDHWSLVSVDRFEALFEGFMDHLSLYKGLEDGESIGEGPETIGLARAEQFPIFEFPHREYMQIESCECWI